MKERLKSTMRPLARWMLFGLLVGMAGCPTAVLESPVFPETSAVPPTGEEACDRIVESSEGPICLDGLIAAIQTSRRARPGPGRYSKPIGS